MKLSESASAEKEKREAEENQQQAKPEVAEEKPAKKAKKSKELSEEAVLEPEAEVEKAEAEEPVSEQVEEEDQEEDQEEESSEQDEELSDVGEEVSLSEKMNIQFELIESQENKIAELERKVSALKLIFGGEEPIGEGDNSPPISKSELKKQLIEKHMKENPENDRFTAHIEVAKENKELFGLKQ